MIVKNDHLLGTGIEHLLRNEADLNVEGVTAVDEPTLVEEIVRTQPDIVITEKAFHGYEPAKLLFLIKEIPKLQLIIVSAAHNLIQVYEKDQILVTHAGDLLAIVRANRNLLRGRVKEAKPDSTRKIG